MTSCGTTPDRTCGLVHAGLDVLLAQPRTDTTQVAAIGYCFGGYLVLELARAGVDWRMNLYGGAQHSFTHPQVDRIEVPGLRFDRI